MWWWRCPSDVTDQGLSPFFPRGKWNPPLLPHQRVSKVNLPLFLAQLFFWEDKSEPKKERTNNPDSVTSWLRNSSLVVSLLNILVFYIMLLSHSLKPVSQPADCTVWSPLSDPMNLESLFQSDAASPVNFSPSLSAAPPAPQKQIQPTGRHVLGRQEILNEGWASSHWAAIQKIYSYFKRQALFSVWTKKYRQCPPGGEVKGAWGWEAQT